ncbi:dienelactone hydrolase family protein [Georgenia satyanarayanai]|uniref:dienelactone hydrolase family protein n=1 Tax=Georgenia satyanarayanai TaxID=860221 RepID=UPI002041793F|nr:dienelactone hydrolase family protein [Georgenia satyanarayanai]MCM3659469.1 dienelactone hydrolase family protein [Georgenia satyanarayanai]
MTAATTTVRVPDGDMPAQLWLPPSGTGPGIVLLQEIFGVSEYIRSRAADLAALGYVVLAPELYWRADGGVDESSDAFLEQGMALQAQLDWETTVADAVASVGTLRSRPEVAGGVGVLGFCFGGGVAFNVAAVTDVDVLVSYYGSALPQLLGLADRVSAPSLHHFGTADTYLPMGTVEEIRAAVAGPEVEFHLHDGANHAFDNPHPLFHHERASADAWRLTTDFLSRRLPV